MTQNLNSNYETNHYAEETLRLVAQLPPPAELAERVHRRLTFEGDAPVRRGFWSLWVPAQRVQFAAAAALVIAVAGPMWSVYHAHPQIGGSSTQAAPVPAPRALPGNSGGFGSAGAVRVPPTLHPIQVPTAPKKKPNPSRVLAKPSPKTPTVPPVGDAAAKTPANQ